MEGFMKFVNLSNDINNVCNLYNMTNEDIICIEKENKNLFKNNIEILRNIDNNDYENLLLNEKFLNIYSEYVKLK